MSVIFRDENKKIEFSIVNYEFPKITKDMDCFGANWLIVKIIYKDVV